MNKIYDKCKYYGFKRCPHHQDDIMRKANQEIPRYYGGKPQEMLPVPTDEEINRICEECKDFTLK